MPHPTPSRKGVLEIGGDAINWQAKCQTLAAILLSLNIKLSHRNFFTGSGFIMPKIAKKKMEKKHKVV